MSLEIRINGATDCSRCERPVEVLHVDVPLVRHGHPSSPHRYVGNWAEPCGCVIKVEVIAADEERKVAA